MNGLNNGDEVVLRAWEELFESQGHGDWDIDLSDNVADKYELTNPQLMRQVRDRLVGKLQGLRSSEAISYKPSFGRLVRLGNKFFSTMSEEEQQTLLAAFASLPWWDVYLGEIGIGPEKPKAALCTPALLDTFSSPANPNLLEVLSLHNIALACATQVQQLSDIIAANKATLLNVTVCNVDCPLTHNKRHQDGTIGFLDPICYALHQVDLLNTFILSATTHPVLSLVSPKALLALFHTTGDTVALNGLGLTDAHSQVIATYLSNHDMSLLGMIVDIQMNPNITDEGYKALLKAANHNRFFPDFYLDDKRWEAEINFARNMNLCYDRLDYLEDGVFPSKKCWVDFLVKVASSPEEVHFSCIYYTIRDYPAFIMS